MVSKPLQEQRDPRKHGGTGVTPARSIVLLPSVTPETYTFPPLCMLSLSLSVGILSDAWVEEGCPKLWTWLAQTALWGGSICVLTMVPLYGDGQQRMFGMIALERIAKL